MAIGIVYGGGIDGGIPSNIGTIKAYYEEKEMALSPGENVFQLSAAFRPQKIMGLAAFYGTYVSGQPMMDFNGVYAADYGISYRIEQAEDRTVKLVISVSGSYTARTLHALIFYQ